MENSKSKIQVNQKVKHIVTGEVFTVKKTNHLVSVCSIENPHLMKGTRILIDVAIIRNQNLTII